MNDQSEKEQLQEIKAWWAENGRFVMTGIVLGIVMIVGWTQWRSSIERSQVEASNLYEDVMSAVADGDAETAEAAANNLYDNYSQTVYPEQARLAMARLYMDKGRDQDVKALLIMKPSDGSDPSYWARGLRQLKISVQRHGGLGSGLSHDAEQRVSLEGELADHTRLVFVVL